MFTKFKTVNKTRKEHQCYNCNKTIVKGSECSFGATNDRDLVRYKNEILTGYFCTDCRPIKLNE